MADGSATGSFECLITGGVAEGGLALHMMPDEGTLNDDGSVPQDNPFVGRAGYKPEIYALGIRNSMGIVIHPVTGEIWESENGPQGGDEVNIIRAGQNYGWPIVSLGRSYGGDRTGDTGPVSDQPTQAGMEQPVLFWAPSIALSGMAFYTGDRFAAWKGSLFLGGLVGTQLQRVVLNQRGLPIRRGAGSSPSSRTCGSTSPKASSPA